MSAKKGALQLSPTQHKQLCNVCQAISCAQEGAGLAPTPGDLGSYFRDHFDIPIWVKPSQQTGAGFWDSVKGIFDRVRKSKVGKQVMDRAVDAGVSAVKKKVGAQARKRGLGDQFDAPANKAGGKAKELIGSGHQCGGGMYPAGMQHMGGGMYPAGY